MPLRLMFWSHAPAGPPPGPAAAAAPPPTGGPVPASDSATAGPAAWKQRMDDIHTLNMCPNEPHENACLFAHLRRAKREHARLPAPDPRFAEAAREAAWRWRCLAKQGDVDPTVRRQAANAHVFAAVCAGSRPVPSVHALARQPGGAFPPPAPLPGDPLAARAQR